ncbi:hypothetical protein GGR56DRAFT_338420 [Xylariaceae sp. FL0804]|nr:hypothetical protein GGR56DRAFT_338420 [Xylariaceae sp. FL0804]
MSLQIPHSGLIPPKAGRGCFLRRVVCDLGPQFIRPTGLPWGPWTAFGIDDPLLPPRNHAILVRIRSWLEDSIYSQILGDLIGGFLASWLLAPYLWSIVKPKARSRAHSDACPRGSERTFLNLSWRDHHSLPPSLARSGASRLAGQHQPARSRRRRRQRCQG